MIDKKILLGVSIAAIFAISMIASQSLVSAAAGDAIQVKSHAIEIDTDANELTVEITSNQDIPTDGSSGALGFGVLTDGTNNVLAITSHLCASDSPVQGAADCGPNGPAFIDVTANQPFTDHDDAGWHAHFLDLKPVTPGGFCDNAGAKLEVDLAETVGSGNNVSPTALVTVVGDTLSVTVPIGAGSVPNPITVTDIGVVSYGLTLDKDNTGAVTDLCLLRVK